MFRRNIAVRLPLAVASLVLVVFAGPAAAQVKEPVRVAAGFSLIKAGATGAGASGGVLVPVMEIGPRSIGIVGAAAFHHRDNTSLTSFGGAVRVTHKWTPKLRSFVQGGLGVIRRHDSVDENDPVANSRTKIGFFAGAGVSVPVNPRFNLIVEADLGALNETYGVAKGVVLTVGFSLPVGKQ